MTKPPRLTKKDLYDYWREFLEGHGYYRVPPSAVEDTYISCVELERRWKKKAKKCARKK